MGLVRSIKPFRRNFDPLRAKCIAVNKKITNAKSAQAILEVIRQDFESFDAVALATAVHRLASLRGAPNNYHIVVSSVEFHKVTNEIQKVPEKLEIRHAANILWGLAKMNFEPDAKLIEILCNEIQNKIDNAVAQNISNTLWALSVLQFRPSDAVFGALSGGIRKTIRGFTSQNISNTVLALAKLDHVVDDATIQTLGEEAEAKRQTFSAQALSNILWGLSRLGISEGKLFQVVSEAAAEKLSDFNAQNIANSLWAYGNLALNPGKDVLDLFATCAISKINDFTPQNLVSSCGILKINCDTYQRYLNKAF